MKSSVFVIILIIAVSATVYLFTKSEDQKVKWCITGLAVQVSKENGESVVKMALRLRGVDGFFWDPVLLEIDEYDLSGLYTPDEVVSLASVASSQFRAFTLKFYDIDVEFADDENADDEFVFVAATAIVTGRFHSGEAFDEAKEVDMELIKAEGEWYLTRITTVDLLEK